MLEGDNVSAWEICGVYFLEKVITPNGRGIVQGVLLERDGSHQVIVSHDPKTLPPEMVPTPCMWKLVYYNPDEITEETNENGRKSKSKRKTR